MKTKRTSKRVVVWQLTPFPVELRMQVKVVAAKKSVQLGHPFTTGQFYEETADLFIEHSKEIYRMAQGYADHFDFNGTLHLSYFPIFKRDAFLKKCNSLGIYSYMVLADVVAWRIAEELEN